MSASTDAKVANPSPASPYGYGEERPSSRHIKPRSVNSRTSTSPIRKLLEIHVLLNLSDTELQERGSPAGSRGTRLTLPPPVRPALPSSPLLQPSNVLSKVCLEKMKWGGHKGSGERQER